MLEQDVNLIISHCDENDDKKLYMKAFYNLLLFYRFHNEKEKVTDLINNKNLIEYFAEILVSYNFYIENFIELELSKQLILEIIKQKNLCYSIIKNIISQYSKHSSIEEILLFINNNCKIIINVCKKEKQNINLSLILPQKIKIKDLNKTLNYIVQISDYQNLYEPPYINIDSLFIYNIMKGIQLSFDNSFLIAKALSPYAKIYDIINILSNALGNSLIPSKLKN